MDRSTLLKKLDELKEQVEERSKKIKKLTDERTADIKKEFARDLMTLPENILEMPMDEFIAKFNGTLDTIAPAPRRSSLRIRNMSLSKYNTPSRDSESETPGRRRSLRTPSTVRRRQEGEMLYSARGSPIDPNDENGNGKPKLFVMLDELDMAHMNLRLVDDKTQSETQVNLSNDADLEQLRKEGKEELAILQVQEIKRKMQAYCDEVMAKLSQSAS
ncbi:hypothetical protein THRCLA_01103 [Thraustotheca clavata]|uniref:Uncharacterized protein n=1 Tax=Thraustotheca clavata TaxID=74557 RepID=A0A1W0A9L2_9STRA|nr:hypothetical protein THRCLA_01103 [Thraustotheca clavata]